MIANLIVFYSRCKPQDVDAIEVALAEKRIFIGYPMARAAARYDPGNLKACVVDPSCSDEEWTVAHAASDKNRQYNRNRNFIKGVTLGSIAMVPRPSRGIIYCGRVVSKFELVDEPSWYERYMQIRYMQNCGGPDSDASWHAADVAQCWSVDNFKPIPLPRIPAWVRRSLFGRSTYGIIHPDEVCGNPHGIISNIIDTDGSEEQSWTLDPMVIEKRMLTDLNPSTFEHLIVSLLQLEHPEEVWSQTGGSGDGGIDGVGAGSNGEVTGLLQCKWQYWGGSTFPTGPVWPSGAQPSRRYLASLRYPDGVIPPDSEFLGRSKIAELVAKHHVRLPQAISMRIGDKSPSEAVSRRGEARLITEEALV